MIVAQEFGLGCGIACVAGALQKPYATAKRLFDTPEQDSTKGFYCKDLVAAFAKAGKQYTFKKYTAKDKAILEKAGTIVFIKPNQQYARGHYLLRTKVGWMNPWVNCPRIKPVKAAIERELPGSPQWVIYELHE